LDAEELAFIGDMSLDTTADTLSGAINEHEADITQMSLGITTLSSRLSTCGMKVYSDTITIPANSSKEIDLSSLLPSGATLKGISSVSLSAYALPYVESGVVKTYVQAVNTASNRITIQNNTSAWTNYTLNFVFFYTVS
jgi:hypothetical protein